MGVCCSVILALIVDCCYSTLASPCPARAPAGESATGTSPLEPPQRESSEEMMSVLLRVLRVQLEVRQQNRDVLHELQQLRHEVRVVSERLDEMEPLDRTRAVSQPALSTVPPVLPRLPANNIEELEAAEAAVQDEAVAATLDNGNDNFEACKTWAMNSFIDIHPVGLALKVNSTYNADVSCHHNDDCSMAHKAGIAFSLTATPSEHPGNMAAHTQARALVNWAESDPPSSRSARDRLLSYHDLTLLYRNSRLIYPPPHKYFPRSDQALWRRLQTATVTTPSLLSIITHGETSPHCHLCPSTRADFEHVFLNCPNKPKPPWRGSEHQERWEAALRSSQPELQLRKLGWARGVAEAQMCPAI
ncbi:hypothetical protein HPB49_008151 [Dermacentor silvarum]|uniref:Uncharacterized protein n=1 Tax=Dermacentor silvarum TaxID=543639 RepID=A0ACB8CQH7_DERSI|nr:hypothetical protein HPB49_008151 [Dermacentor silvarum]